MEADEFVTGIGYKLGRKELLFLIFCGRACQTIQLVLKLNGLGPDLIFVVCGTSQANDLLSSIQLEPGREEFFLFLIIGCCTAETDHIEFKFGTEELLFIHRGSSKADHLLSSINLELGSEEFFFLLLGCRTTETVHIELEPSTKELFLILFII